MKNNIKEKINELFELLDEAIDDIENDNLLTEEEFWKEIKRN